VELDVTTLEYTYLFLKDLETQGFVCYKLVFKVVSKLTGKTSYINFNSLEDYYTRYSFILDDVKPNKYCIVGDFIFLENIKFVNNAVTYENNIFYYNVSDGNPKSKVDIRYNTNKNKFFGVDNPKFVTYLKEQLIAYFNRNIFLQTTRNSAYVDACYVDPGYVGPSDYNPTDMPDGSGLE
jgi:hypothetical protein